MRRFLIAVIVGLLVVGVFGPAVAVHDDPSFFRAKKLRDCVTRRGDQSHQFSGEYVRAAGIRFYAEKGQRGRNVTYCVNVRWSGGDPNSAGPDGGGVLILPRSGRMWRNAESLRVIVELCHIAFKHLNKRGELGWRGPQPDIGPPDGKTIHRQDIRLPKRWQDRIWRLAVDVSC